MKSKENYWRPIETAPQNGTPVDIWRPGRVGRVGERCPNMRRVDLGGGNVFYEPVESGPTCVRNATHWAALPDPPVDAAPTTPEGTMLCNLLARIHGDGGHYIEQHGLEKAVEGAEFLVAKWRAGLKPVEDIELVHLQANSRLWMFVEKNPWRAIDVLRDGCSNNPAFWGDEARAAIDLSAWEEL